jgi:hypothetical protein
MMKMKTSNSYQVGGDHYASKTVQPWEAMESWMSHEAFAGYLLGNCLKYLARYRDKNGTQDLQKCQHYLAKLIEIEQELDAMAENGDYVDKHQYEAGRQSAINGGQINNAFRATMHKDWLKGYDQVKAETND